MAAVGQSAETRTALQQLATELLPTAPELGRGMAEHLSSAIPEFAPAIEDPELRAELEASSAANVAQVMRLLARSASAEDVVVDHEALEFMRGNVRRGLPLSVLLRSYRLGHAWLWGEWSHALQERVEDSGELAAGQDQSSAFMFAYVDKVSDVLVEEFGNERERMVRGAEQLRAETTRAILGGEPVDEEVASSRLGYELLRHHVAIRVSSGASAVRGLERAVHEAAAILGAGDPLVVASGAARFDVWQGSFDVPATDGLEGYEPPPGVLVAFGRPAAGIEGFRSSHAEALQAARVCSLATGARAAVMGYGRVELVSLLASDLPRARAFVAAQLGPLSSTAEPAERIRETVLAFLAAGLRPSRVAKDLHVHPNTVAYRVKRGEELLGRNVTEDSVELACALTLAAVLGPSVLSDDAKGFD